MTISSVSCQVELFGIARLTAGKKSLLVSLPIEATVRDAIVGLIERCPELSGKVSDANGTRLLPGYALNINGVSFVDDLDIRLQAGDALIVLSADSGG